MKWDLGRISTAAALCALLLTGCGQRGTVTQELPPETTETAAGVQTGQSDADAAAQTGTETAPGTEAQTGTETVPGAEAQTRTETAPGKAQTSTETVPAALLEGVSIGLDPGHQRYANTDPETIAPDSSETKMKVTGGASGDTTGIPEYETNLQIALLLRDKLEALGAQVYMTRESHDVDISNQERAKMMNDYGVDLVLRIHCDSADSASVHGCAMYVSESNSIAAQSLAYAQTMLPILSQNTGAEIRDIYVNDNYTGQNWSTVPCIMVECGYLSNPEEDVLLNSPAYQEKIAQGLSEGICAVFGGKPL